MKRGALVLAAGSSRRFGSDKRQFPLQGQTALLRRSVENVVAAGLACRVCLRPGDAAIRALLQELPLQYLECASARDGMGCTLAEGVAACADWDGLLVVLGDMPWVQPQTLQQLSAALTPERIVQPLYRDQPGNPVGFGSDFFPLLQQLKGDRGARQILQQYPAAVHRLALQDPGILRDVDCESDLIAPAGH